MVKTMVSCRFSLNPIQWQEKYQRTFGDRQRQRGGDRVRNAQEALNWKLSATQRQVLENLDAKTFVDEIETCVYSYSYDIDMMKHGVNHY